MRGEVTRMNKKDEIRCECGSLLARLTKDKLEVKCRRCKRVWIIPVNIKKEVIKCCNSGIKI
ncbi:MAG: hypothetical protein A3J72_10125 [Nitrospirae bacterium RIFCSPHIGHO2_02_FULL_40_19]|nr:MAG: hypothetical protein A3J72_10125 [Nitrospirae bacterium RIFCSPHIGHO2_02_FULL_40_19]